VVSALSSEDLIFVLGTRPVRLDTNPRPCEDALASSSDRADQEAAPPAPAVYADTYLDEFAATSSSAAIARNF
jgi:hypothetical protein